MCCRYYMEESPMLRPYIQAARCSSLAGSMVDRLGKPVRTAGEIKPADIAPVLAPGRDGQVHAFPMIWGFTGKTSYLFNARSETADIRPTFKDSWARRRCIIPACHYYEWQHLTSPGGKKKTGDKYMIQPAGETLTLMAGLYRLEDHDGMVFPHFTVLTMEPPEEIMFIHDRMPVILSEKDAERWLDPASPLPEVRETCRRSLTKMVFEKAAI